jgi:hypothetical protein
MRTDDHKEDDDESDEDSPHARAKFDWSSAEGLEVIAPPSGDNDEDDTVKRFSLTGDGQHQGI